MASDSKITSASATALAPALAPATGKALYIRMHAGDNVAIVVNDGGLPASTQFDDGLTLLEAVPQGHKVALTDIALGQAIIRYNVTIGYALRDIAAGSWGWRRGSRCRGCARRPGS